MKSKFLKMAVVAASALAFMNCGDSGNPAQSTIPDDPTSGLLSSSSAGENGLPELGSSSSIENGPVANVSSSSEDAVGPMVGVSSSDASSENPVAGVSSSSNPAVKPAVGSSSSVKPVVSSSSSVPEAPKGIFLANDKDENKDYMEVVYQTNTGDNGGGVLAYPKRLSETQKHGVVLWGPGGGSKPTEYEGIIKRLASHGFVVIATSESPNGTERGIPALNWLDKKNNTPGDPLYQKLDMNVVGASGHSMGGLQSEQMLINDKRVKTAIMNNSGAWDGKAAALVPTGQGKTIALVYGEVGSESDNAKNDYNNPGVKIPACLLRMENNNYGHGSGPWDGQAATVAWMRWHLGGEDFRKADFVGSTGKYINGPVYTWQGAKGNWKGQCKNF